MIFDRFFSRKAKKSSSILPKDFHKKLDPDAVDIVQTLQKKGFKAYLVGGCVRDLIIGVEPKDFDIATNATPAQVKDLIHKSQIIGRRFKIVVAFRRPHSARANSRSKRSFNYFPPLRKTRARKEFQITTFRAKPKLSSEGRDENVFGNERQDAFRRDFTINGLFLDPKQKGTVIDYVGGIADFKKKEIKIIGNAGERLREDSIRILRALRFKAKTKLEFNSQTEQALLKNIAELKTAKRERLREEVLKCWKDFGGSKAFQLFTKYLVWKNAFSSMDHLLSVYPEKKKNLKKILDICEKKPWKNERFCAPFFYLMAWELFEPQKKRHSLQSIYFEDFRVSRLEQEFIRRISRNLIRLRENLKNTEKVSLKINRRNFENWAQTAYVLYILSEAKINHYPKLWKAFEPEWRRVLEKSY